MKGDFCIKITPKNRATIRAWFDDESYEYSPYSWYGIRDGRKFGTRSSENLPQEKSFRGFMIKLAERGELDKLFKGRLVLDEYGHTCKVKQIDHNAAIFYLSRGAATTGFWTTQAWLRENEDISYKSSKVKSSTTSINLDLNIEKEERESIPRTHLTTNDPRHLVGSIKSLL